MLYTLALFVLEPATWAKKWGWRDLTGLERQASRVMFFQFSRGLVGYLGFMGALEGCWNADGHTIHSRLVGRS
jgi:hypothetical protein